MTSNSCVIIVGVPCSGEALLGKAFLAMGYTADGTQRDPSQEWPVLAINQTICDRAQNPKIDLATAKYAHAAIDDYVREKVANGNPWIINDPLLCISISEFIPFLKKYGVDYKIVVTIRQLHHSALDVLKSDKTWKIGDVAALIGKYAVSRSMAIERITVNDKEIRDKIIYVSTDDLRDKPEEEIESIVKLLKLDVSDEKKKAAVAAVTAA